MAGTVTVACKMPHGLVLRLFKKTAVPEPQQSGTTKEVDKWVPDLARAPVVLKGYLDRYKPGLPPAAKGSSYALTTGVDKDFFDEWLKQNSDHDAVVNHLIFAGDKPDGTKGLANDHKDTRSGLEPLDPARLPRGISTYRQDEKAA